MKSIMEEGSSIFKALEKAWIRAGKPQEFSVKIFEEEQKNFFGMTKRSAKVAIFFDERKIAPAAEPKKEIIKRDARAPQTYQQRESRESREQSSYQQAPRRPRERDYDRDHDQEHRERRAPAPQRQQRPMERTYERPERPERTEHKEEAPRAPRPERQQPVAPRAQEQHQAPERERVPENREERAPEAQQSSAPKNVLPKDVVDFAHNWLESVFKDIGYTESFALDSADNTLHFVLNKPVTTSDDKEQMFFRSCSYLMMAALRNAFDQHDFRNTKIVISQDEAFKRSLIYVCSR